MNIGLSEMLHHSQNTDMGIAYFNENEQIGLAGAFMASNSDQSLSGILLSEAIKPDPGLENGWNDDFRRVLSYENISSSIPRTLSCPPNVSAAMAEAAVSKGKEAVYSFSSSATGRESSKKRKADKTQNLMLVAEEKSEEKKMKECEEHESKIKEQNSNTKSTTTTATNNKNGKGGSANTNENSKSDYIHVRARRGQATDSHSLAERVRREKISERMKYLQDLVPGCNKITGKAGMLDEIINYVQSLQRQVEFLSMKLAAINPRLDCDIDNYIVKEFFPTCTSNIPTIGTSSQMVNHNHTHLQFNTLVQGALGSSLEMVENPMDVTPRRTISAPVSIQETLLGTVDMNMQHLTWEDELQNLYSTEYQQGRSTSFISQPFSGLFEANHVKMEM